MCCSCDGRMYVLKCNQFENSLADITTLLCFLTDSDDDQQEDGPQEDDFGMDENANPSNTVSTMYGAAPSQSRGDSRQRKGKGHQTAMQGDHHAGRGSSRGGGRIGRHAAKGDGNINRSTGKAARGATHDEADTANPNTSTA